MSEQIPSVKELLDQAKKVFSLEFGENALVASFAPGRVNLIGEHTDYNDGFVLPMAIPLRTVIVGKRIMSDESIVITTNQDADEPRKVIIDMPSKKTFVNIQRPGKPDWANYVKGVLANYIGPKPAFKCVVHSSVPTGGGLSSSASLEVAMYTFLDALNGDTVNTIMPTDKALACQKAEHDFAGMPCGIMDQFISVMGKEDNVLLIDCRLLTSKLIPFKNSDMVVLITNSNVKHKLTGSEYSSRRMQCIEAARLLNVQYLRDATLESLKDLRSNTNISKDVIKRAQHVITEINRTTKAAEALQNNDFITFGRLMNESHESLKNDFEVSCKELNELVEYALQIEGVLGSRMTGGGFGGCTVTLVEKNSVNMVMENIRNKYKGKPTFYICTPSNGAYYVQI